MQMVTFIMDTGKMIKHMGLESILTQMGQDMKVIGLMINNMVKVKKNGLMEQNMKEIINSERKMDLEGFCGQISLFMREILLIIIYMDMENINGLMAVNLQVNGT